MKKNPLDQMSLVEPNIGVHQELLANSAGAKEVEIIQYLDEIGKEQFELTVGIHVFDHLLDPLGDLKIIAAKSAKDAFLAVVVHNEGSFLRKIIKLKWPPICLQHPQLYNPDTLKKMLSAGGWEVKESARSTNYFHLNHIAKMALGVLGLPKILSKVLPAIEVPINLGNMITLASKK